MTTDPTLLVAIYGDYGPWFGPWFESALATGHRRFIIVSDGAHEDTAQRLVTAAFEGSRADLSRVDDDADYTAMIQDPRLKPYAYLAAWRRAFRLLPPGAPFVACHVDTILQRNLAAAWLEARPKPFGLALPAVRHGTRWVFEPIFLCGTAAPVVQGELSNLLRETVRLSGSADRERMMQVYGSFTAGAAALLASRMQEGGGTIVGQLPATWCSRLDPQAAVVHFAGQPPDPTTVLGQRWATLGDAYRARTEVVRA